MITSGTQQALDILGRVLLAPGDRVAMEDPGYRPPRLLFESLGARVSGVARYRVSFRGPTGVIRHLVRRADRTCDES